MRPYKFWHNYFGMKLYGTGANFPPERPPIEEMWAEHQEKEAALKEATEEAGAKH